MLRRYLLLLCLGLALSGCRERIPAPPAPTVAPMPAPHFELLDLEGKPVSSDSLRGQIVILNFWATWSPQTVREIPEWIALQTEYGRKGVSFVGINLDSEGAAVARPFVEKRGINYTTLIGNLDLGADFGGLDNIPSTFVIDRDWTLVNRYSGLASPESIRSEIYALLQKDRTRVAVGTPAQAKQDEEDGAAPYAPKLAEPKGEESQPAGDLPAGAKEVEPASEAERAKADELDTDAK